MKNVRKLQQGFTLIELMIVIAILGILIAIALPAYQDYSIRTKNTECLNVAAAAKLAVAEYWQTEGAFPGTADTHGYEFATAGTTYCAAVSIGDGGTITTTATNTGATPALGLSLAPTAINGAINWACTATTTQPAAQVPSECR